MGRRKKSTMHAAEKARKMNQKLKSKKMKANNNPLTKPIENSEHPIQIDTSSEQRRLSSEVKVIENLENDCIQTRLQDVREINSMQIDITSEQRSLNSEVNVIENLENDCNIQMKPQDDCNIQMKPQDVHDKSSIQVPTTSPCQQISSFSNEGRRIIDIAHFYSKLKDIAKHGVMDCGLECVDIVRERQEGLHSIFTLRCKMCNDTFYLETELPCEININHCAVAGTIAAGCGHSQLQEISAAMNLPIMSTKTYNKCQQKLSNHWEKISIHTMNEAAAEERELAIAEGRMDKNNTPIIDVIVDGCWSKRTYKKNYSALSGAAAIIGKKTGKVLFLGVRNKYCSICAHAQNKNQEPRNHKCYKNYNGSSTAMESDILIEGFKCSVEMHNLIYGRMVSDGDSSTYSKLLQNRPYPNITIEKIECRNHLLRNFCNKLTALQTDTKYLVKFRKIITHKRIMNLRCTIRKILTNHKADSESLRRGNIELLYNDILLAHLHSFGDHSNCKAYFCDVRIDKENPNKEIMDKDFFTSTLWSRICILMSNLASHAPSLIHDVDSNKVENLNSIIAKLVGGKRINFSKRGSYQMRCHAAVVSFNTRKVISSVYKSMTGRSPRGSIAKLEKRRTNKIIMEKRIKRKKNRKLFSKGEDLNYGEGCEKPDMPSEIFEKQKETFLQNLVRTREEKEKIEKETILQSSCSEWLELRRNLLTASNFGKIVKRRNNISCHNLVKEILYKDSIAHVTSVKHGIDNEKKAIKQLEIQENIKISPCGLFIDEHHHFLGATPDGLVDDDTIVEIKCPITAYEKDIIDVIKSKKVTIFKLKENNELTLNKNHNWYFQIQGQLHIANKKKCLLAIWCGENKKIKVEKIERDDGIWQEMEPKLVKFYMDCLLPELVDPRLTRKMKIRDPNYNETGIKKKVAQKRKSPKNHTEQQNVVTKKLKTNKENIYDQLQNELNVLKENDNGGDLQMKESIHISNLQNEENQVGGEVLSDEEIIGVLKEINSGCRERELKFSDF